jgi:putative CocE/NonD family hydrolase
VTSRIIVERGVSTKMRDGVTLASDVYRRDDSERHPVLLVRTPYDRTYPSNAFSAADPLFMAERGYAVVVQDVRGRFGSEGVFETYVNEAADGYDTVQWAAGQPWSDGTVGMYGLSYMAQVQYLAASQRPAALRAIAPIESPASAVGADRYRGGALALGLLASWAMQAIVPAEVMRRAQQDPTLWAEFPGVVDDIDNLDQWMEQLPLVPWPPIDHRAGGLSQQFDETVRYEYHPPRPRFHASDIVVPALLFAGWHDVFLQACLDMYCAIKRSAGSEEARGLTRLWVGPWSHGTPTSTVGEVDMGFRASPFLLDMKESLTRVHRRWFDARLRGKDSGIDREAPVKIFVMGLNRWRDEDSWPPARAQDQSWYLHGNGGLSPVPPDMSTPSVFALDPQDPVRTWGGGLLMAMKYVRGPADQARTEAHKDMLLFTSDVLDAPLEVTGRIKLRAWVASETPDTDLVARLCDVHPDGRSYNVVDGILRLRFRDGLDREALLTPGEVVEAEVDLWSTAHVFLAGHCLRLHVCASDFPRYDRCPGTGQTSADVASVLFQRNLLFHDPKHPTHLELPVLAD